MASGKKNYFRHSFFARNDDFINDLISKFSHHGYMMWFCLLEICGEMAVDEYPESFTLTEHRLMKELRCNRLKLNLFLAYVQDKSKISYTYVEDKVSLRIANLPKYLGKYETNWTKERKVNKIKEKESKGNTSASFSSPPSLNERDAIPIEFKKEFGKKLLESNWGKNHDYFYANNVKKDYFEFQRESLARSRDKFGDEMQDQKDVVNFLKKQEERHEQIRRNIKAQKENSKNGERGKAESDSSK